MLSPEEIAFNAEYLKTQWSLVQIGYYSLASTLIFSILFYTIYRKQAKIAEEQVLLNKELVKLNEQLIRNNENESRKDLYRKNLLLFKEILTPVLSVGYDRVHSNSLKEIRKKIMILYPDTKHIMLHALQELSLKYNFSEVNAKADLDLLDTDLKID